MKKRGARSVIRWRESLILAGGGILLYGAFVLVLLFLLERQPSSFIYVSF